MLHRGLAALVVALLTWSGCGAAEIGRDTLMSASEAHEWRGVGRINVAGYRHQQMCTGTLIAPDVVLTAAHCLVDRHTGVPHPPGTVHFVAGWHKGEKTGHRRGRAAVFHQDWLLDEPLRSVRVHADLALLRLSSGMSEREGPPFRLADAPQGDAPVLLISYRGDRPHALSRQDDCRILSVRGVILTLRCAIISGASGSPIFAGDGLGVAAVLSAKDGGLAYAVAAEDAVSEMLQRLP